MFKTLLYFQTEISKLSRKEERLMTSVLHKANVERQTRIKQQTIQQQQQQQQQQLLQQQLLQQSMQQELTYISLFAFVLTPTGPFFQLF